MWPKGGGEEKVQKKGVEIAAIEDMRTKEKMALLTDNNANKQLCYF